MLLTPIIFMGQDKTSEILKTIKSTNNEILLKHIIDGFNRVDQHQTYLLIGDSLILNLRYGYIKNGPVLRIRRNRFKTNEIDYTSFLTKREFLIIYESLDF